MIKQAHGGIPHVTISAQPGVLARTAGDLVRSVKLGNLHGVTHVAFGTRLR